MSRSASRNHHEYIATILSTLRWPEDEKHQPLMGIDTKYDKSKRAGPRVLNITITVKKIYNTEEEDLTGEIPAPADGTFAVDIELKGIPANDLVFFRWTIAPEPAGPFSMMVTTIGMPFTPNNADETITVEMPPLFIWPADGLAYFAVELVRASDQAVIDTESGFNLRRPA